MMNQEFEAWWNASKYMQVVISSEATKQAAKDGWDAAMRLVNEWVVKNANQPQ